MQNYPAIITVFFTDKNGVPALGLLPAITIYQISSTIGSPQGDTIVIGDGSPLVFMTEVGRGFYKYVFTTYNSRVKYAYQINGEAGGTGPTLGLGQYVVGTNENFAEDIAHEVWEEPKNLHLTGSPETMGLVLNQIFNSTVGSPQGSGPSFTVNDIVAGVWGEVLNGSPLPYPPNTAGGLIPLISQTSGLTQDEVAQAVWTAIVNQYSAAGSPQTFGYQFSQIFNTLVLGAGSGSPQIPLTVSNIVVEIWNELLAGSPTPYPTGSAGALINTIAQSAGLTPAQVTAAVWDVHASNYPSTGSPQTMGTQLSLTTENSVNILDFTELIVASQYNRTFLDKTAATLTIYASDNVTPLRVFSLRDSGGTPSITEIVDRFPIVGSPLTTPPPSP